MSDNNGALVTYHLQQLDCSATQTGNFGYEDQCRNIAVAAYISHHGDLFAYCRKHAYRIMEVRAEEDVYDDPV